ncbi:hypothetical protein B4U80_12284, partial [Leptotrombidium deliense]
RERQRIYSKIKYGAEHFWEYVSPKAKDDLKDTQRKIIETKLASILVWCNDHMNSPIDEISDKENYIDNLIEEVQKFNHDNEYEGVYVGIDFGTANCSISIANSNICDTIELEDGLRIPSIVAFNKSVLIGTEAKKYIGSSYTVFGVKQLLGKTVNAAFKDHVKNLPYAVDTSFERAYIVIDNGGIAARFNVESIAAFVLMKQKMSAEIFLNRNLDTVSITVPAKFTASQRQSLHNAARISGFENIHLVNDNIALLLHHVNQSNEDVCMNEKYIVAVSMGAAYLNITVAIVSNNCIEINRTWHQNIG